MRKPPALTRSLFIGLMMCEFLLALLLVMPQSAKAQSKVDLKTLKAKDAADLITASSYKLVKFFEDEKIVRAFEEVRLKGNEKSDQKDYAEMQGEELKILLRRAYIALLELIARLRTSNFWDEQLDKDVAKLVTGSHIKSQLEKYGGARKLLESGLNQSSVNGLTKDINNHAALIIWQAKKTKETCRYITIGAVVMVLDTKKPLSYDIKGGCKE